MNPKKAVAILLIALSPALAIAESVYRITDIGDLPGGSGFVSPEGLNNDGKVVGTASIDIIGLTGFLWDSVNGMQELVGFFPSGINDATVVIGTAVFPGDRVHPALWDSVNGVQDLGVLPGGDDYGNGRGINNAGQAVGDSSGHAFLWDSINGMQDLGSLVGDSGGSVGYAINGLGQVVGESETASLSHAFLWDDVNGMQDLGILPGTLIDGFSRANDINDAGQVVGGSSFMKFIGHAFLWDSVNGMQDLGALPGADNSSSALGINEAGQIVGVSGNNDEGFRAVLWDNGSIIDLNDLIDPSDPLAPYVMLWTAVAINDSGQILAQGGGGTYLLSPVDLFLDLAALPDVDDSGSSDVVVVSETAAANPVAQAVGAKAAAIDPGIHVFVRDGATGTAIAETRVFNARWRALDLAVTDNGANSLVAVLAQNDDGTISVAVHRARNGALVRKIAFFNRSWLPVALAYVPDAEGPGNSAFAVLAKNVNDNRVAVQLRRRGDGSLINTTTYFKNIWEPIDLQVMADMSGNDRPEIVVLARSDVGKIVAAINDATSRETANKISYLGKTVMPKAMTLIGSIGDSAAPELAVLGVRPDGKPVVQNRDAATDELISTVSAFNGNWLPLDIRGLDDVNGNTAADLAILAQHKSNGKIQVDVRDAFTGDLIQAVTFLSASWQAHAFAVFGDITGNGVQELGVVARQSDGDIRVQIRDASTGLAVTTINIP